MNRILIFNIFHSIESCTVVPFSRPRNINVIDILIADLTTASFSFSFILFVLPLLLLIGFCFILQVKWYFGMEPLVISSLSSPWCFSTSPVDVFTRTSFLPLPVILPRHEARPVRWSANRPVVRPPFFLLIRRRNFAVPLVHLTNEFYF